MTVSTWTKTVVAGLTAGLVVLSALTMPAAADDADPPLAGPSSADESAAFTPLPYGELLDTRSSAEWTTLSSSRSITIPVLGRAGVPEQDVEAVALDITTIASTSSSWVSVHPSGNRSGITNHFTTPGHLAQNNVYVAPGSDGKVSIYTGGQDTEIVVAAVGYFAATDRGSAFTASDANRRLLDTRSGEPLGPGKSVTIRDASLSGANAAAVSVTTSGATQRGYLSAGTALGTVGLDYDTYATSSSLITGVYSDGFTISNRGQTATHVIVDLQGTFAPSVESGRFHLAASRLFDSRNTTAVPAGGERSVKVAGAGQMPSTNVSAYVLSITALPGGAAGFLRAYPTGSAEFGYATVNFEASGNRSTSAIISASGKSGEITVRNRSSQPINFLVDSMGYFDAGDSQQMSAPVQTPMTQAYDPNPGLADRADEVKSIPLLAGRLFDDAGNPVLDREVEAFLEPSVTTAAGADDGTGVALIALGSVRTDPDDGTFKLRTADLGDLAGYVNEDGSTSALIASRGTASEDSTSYYHVPLYPPTATSEKWTWADPVAAAAGASDGDVSAMAEPETTPDASSLEPPPSDVTGEAAVISDPGSDFDVAVSLALPSGSAAASSGTASASSISDPTRFCGDGSWSVYWVRRDNNIIYRAPTIAQIYTRGKTKATYVYTDGSETQIDAAANVGRGGALVSVGYSKVQARGLGMTFPVGPNSHRLLKPNMDWRAFELQCRENLTGKTKKSGRWEWRPYKVSGGNVSVTTRAAPFKCHSGGGSKPQTISGKLQVSKSTSTSWSAGVAWSNSLSLRTMQRNTKSHRLTFELVGSAETAVLCGDTTNNLGEARRVRET